MIKLRGLFVLVVSLLTLGVPRPVLAQRAPFPIPDPDPEVERKSFIVADGFEVNLFAADPILAKPIQINFDPAGRLWVASSEVYPQIQPGQKANDRILVLEDADGDGKAEKTTVFADGLLIPTGVEPGDGGAYVANSTELLHLKDTDGDGKADTRRVMLSGFGTEDTHHILHTFRWGFDGMLYFNQSIYIHSHIETPHGVRRLGGGGIWQFRPETMELDVFIRGLVNPWGYHFDRWGQSFATDGAGGEGINYCLPGAYYVTAPGAARILPGLNPGSPKYCGEEFLSGRHLPGSWAGSLLTNDFRGNRVCRFTLSDDGAGFAAREQPELIRTRHVAFRPIDVKMGPDGAIYIADWYNPIIQHGEVDFRDPRRDHTRGRIWRVTAKDRPLVPRPKLVGASTDELLEALRAPEDWTRHHARRVLKERGKSVLPALAAWVKRLDPSEPDFEHLRLEALWTYQALDQVEPELLTALLHARDPRARAAATRLTGHWHARLSDPLGLLAERTGDDHPRVRLEAVRALARIPGARSAELAMSALDRPVDRFLDYALWLTARELAPSWLPDVENGRFDFGGKPRHEVFALQAIGTPAIVGPLMSLLRAGKIAEDQLEGMLTSIATLGGPDDLAKIFDLVAGSDRDAATPARRSVLLDALVKAGRQRGVRPAGDLARLGPLLDAGNLPLRAAACQAAGVWKVETLRPKLTEMARSDQTPDPVLRAAIDALAELGGKESRRVIEELSANGTQGRGALHAIGALAGLDLNEAAARGVERLGRVADASEVEALLGRFLQLRQGPEALARALRNHTLPADVAKMALRAVRASGRASAPLTDALTGAGKLKAAPPLPTAEQMQQLVADVARLGDPARGEAVFRRTEQSCLKCHAVAGAGGQVGPSLESIGASAPVDYLIDSLLQPSKAIKENYHAVVVATSDGKLVTGIKKGETASALVLRDAEDAEVVIPLSAIDEQKPGGSLMPTGLTDSLTRGEFLDLVRFLSELGKIGPYSVGKARVARRWQVLEATRSTAEKISREGLDAAVEGNALASWVPAYSQVSGTLPLDALRPARTYQGQVALARTQLDVSTGGPVALAFNATDELKLWIDGSRIETRPQVVLDLKPGVHTLTLAVSLPNRREGILCTLEDVPGSPARAQLVVGK